MARYKKLSGYDVLFSTGTDEHGQKIASSAEKVNLTPLELADKVVLKFKNLWPLLNIEYDDFIRTTEPRHIKVVQEIFKLTDETCPTCGKKIEKIKEESYFFKMSKYQVSYLREEDRKDKRRKLFLQDVKISGKDIIIF